MTRQETINEYLPLGFKAEPDGNIAAFDVPAEKIAAVSDELYSGKKMQLKTIVATDERQTGGGFKIRYVFGLPKESLFFIPVLDLGGAEAFPSIARHIHEASEYERRIHTFFGLEPVGHPALKRIILHKRWPAGVFPLRKDFNWNRRPDETEESEYFHPVKGEGIFEIPVGPVHAGIIEPGHFRFSMAGEEMVSLEAKLGYKHKGIEKLFETLPFERTVALSERVSGDTSFSHSLAYCQALEALAGISAPARAAYLRVVFSELERLANHFNDIGFIMLDAGFAFGGANGARLRELIMQLNDDLTGSRFLRAVNVVGGTAKDIAPETVKKSAGALKRVRTDFEEFLAIAEDSGSLFNRLQSTGVLDRQTAVDHGAIGIAGRAVGIKHDARIEYPYAAYGKMDFPIALESAGDVRARLYVRIKEVRASLKIVEQAFKDMPKGPVITEKNISLRKNGLAIGVTEGWRGDIVYFVATDGKGRLARVCPRDPSFINWQLMGHTIKGNIVADFPLINKSYNLSYSGNDL